MSAGGDDQLVSEGFANVWSASRGEVELNGKKTLDPGEQQARSAGRKAEQSRDTTFAVKCSDQISCNLTRNEASLDQIQT